ncbi:MAG TPA: hypothetical protein VKT28_10960 [Puia sp.]|nr:hypothetical protein [Puia sp.]
MPASSKTSAKKSSSKTKADIKYEDKSAGQPAIVLIFEEIKKLLLPYAKGSIKLHGGDNGKIILISEKNIEIAGRKYSEIWFASALVQKGYVGFYYMPIYTQHDKINKLIAPELLKTLKGKACFHIKKPDAVIYSQIKDALKIGYNCYKEMGWV